MFIRVELYPSAPQLIINAIICGVFGAAQNQDLRAIITDGLGAIHTGDMLDSLPTQMRPVWLLMYLLAK